METEARDLLPRHLRRLQHGEASGNLELDAVDGELGHGLYSAAIARGCVSEGGGSRAAL